MVLTYRQCKVPHSTYTFWLCCSLKLQCIAAPQEEAVAAAVAAATVASALAIAHTNLCFQQRNGSLRIQVSSSHSTELSTVVRHGFFGANKRIQQNVPIIVHLWHVSMMTYQHLIPLIALNQHAIDIGCFKLLPLNIY